MAPSFAVLILMPNSTTQDNNGGIRARKSEINSAAGDDTDSPTEDETEDETEERKRRLDLDSRAAPSKRQRR
jgi:hypothetical protein